VNINRTRIRKFSVMLLFMVMVSLVAACGPKAPAVDPNLVYTQAAETVAVQLAETQAAVPPATATAEPSATPEVPTVTATTVIIPTFTPNAGAATLAAIPTSTQVVFGGGDKADWAYTSPADGAVLKPGQVFQVAIGWKNIGSTTWTQDYKMVFSGGTQISAVTSLSYDTAGGDKLTIPPGEKAEFIFEATAPAEPGSYISYWTLKSPAGAYIYDMYFAYKVE